MKHAKGMECEVQISEHAHTSMEQFWLLFTKFILRIHIAGGLRFVHIEQNGDLLICPCTKC